MILDRFSVTDQVAIVTGSGRGIGAAAAVALAEAGADIVLAARTEGLAGVLTTMVVREEPAVAALLGVPDTHTVAGVLALGHPVSQPTRLRRGPVEDFATIDRFDGPVLTAAP